MVLFFLVFVNVKIINETIMVIYNIIHAGAKTSGGGVKKGFASVSYQNVLYIDSLFKICKSFHYQKV